MLAYNTNRIPLQADNEYRNGLVVLEYIKWLRNVYSYIGAKDSKTTTHTI